MKRWFSLLLLLGALIGLMGQEAAFAQALPSQPTEQAAAAAPMSVECAQMMELTKQQPEPGKPCQGMTPDCVAKMGCAVPVALLPPMLSGSALAFTTLLPKVAPSAALTGRTLAPEPEPPARLG